MSYDIELLDPITKKRIVFDSMHEMRGGTYQMGGTNDAWLNITYNYSPHYRRAFGAGGIRTLYGMTGAESMPLLRTAIGILDDDVDPNYWTATEGNAKRALCQLLAMAQMRPDGVWNGY